jgi:hypothetical protein
MRYIRRFITPSSQRKMLCKIKRAKAFGEATAESAGIVRFSAAARPDFTEDRRDNREI